MTPHAGPDPVNKWATEHYGFEDDAPDPDHGAVAPSSPPVAATAQQPVNGAPRPHRRTVLLATGALSLALIAGIGGAAVAAGSGPEGQGGASDVNFGQGEDFGGGDDFGQGDDPAQGGDFGRGGDFGPDGAPGGRGGGRQ
jgi:hypothetical protein